MELETERLFILAWSRPLDDLKHYFGVSDKALHNRLKDAGIPMPEGPFWARRHEGYFLGFPPFPDKLRGKQVIWNVPEDFDLGAVEESLDVVYREEATEALTSHVPPQPVTREALYNLVWSHKPDDLSKHLQTSRADIKAACKKHAIPMPVAQDWSNVAQNAKMRRRPMPGEGTRVALKVRGTIDVGSLLTQLPPSDEVSLPEIQVGPGAEYLINSWWQKRQDRKRASRAGVKHGLQLFELAGATQKDLMRFFADYPKPPANKIRVRLTKFGLSPANLAEILSSLASVSAFYQVPDAEIQKRFASVDSRLDGLEPHERLAMVRTFLTWFENNPPARQAERWRHARDHSMYALMHYCGLRIGTLTDAKKKDLDLFRGTLTYLIDGELKTCRFPQEVVTPLWRYGSSNPPDKSDYLFVNHHGNGLHRSGANSSLNERLREAHLSQDLQLRSIRMTFDLLKVEAQPDQPSLGRSSSKGRKGLRNQPGKPAR